MAHITFKERFEIPRYDDPEKIKYGVARVETEKCTGCELCVKTCPADAFDMKDKKSFFKPGGGCMGCGDCVAICPEDAIILEKNYHYSGRFKTICMGEMTLPRL